MAENTPARIEDIVEQKIKAQFIELIPDEQFKALVNKAISEFTRSGGFDNDKRSPLEKMILEEIKTIFAAQLKDELTKPEYGQKWKTDGTGHGPSDVVKALLAELTPHIIEAQYGMMVQAMVNQIRSGMQNGSIRPY